MRDDCGDGEKARNCGERRSVTGNDWWRGVYSVGYEGIGESRGCTELDNCRR